MSNDIEREGKRISVQSSRFGELSVLEESVIQFPVGVVGFPRHNRFIMIEHKPPFCWLQSVEDSNLAFVVVDGLQFGDAYRPDPPFNDSDIDLQPKDDFAILVIVTVRPDPRMTTANLKAPLFVNLRNRKGVQVIYDNPKLSTRFPLWAEAAAVQDAEPAEPKKEDEPE